MLPSASVLKLEKKMSINFIMTFAHFSLKRNSKQKLAYKQIFLLSFFFSKKNIKSIKNLSSNIVPSSMAKGARKEKVHLYVKFLSAKLCILPNRNPQNCVKTTNQNWVPNQTKTTRRACITDKHRITGRREGYRRRVR